MGRSKHWTPLWKFYLSILDVCHLIRRGVIVSCVQLQFDQTFLMFSTELCLLWFTSVIFVETIFIVKVNSSRSLIIWDISCDRYYLIRILEASVHGRLVFYFRDSISNLICLITYFVKWILLLRRPEISAPFKFKFSQRTTFFCGKRLCANHWSGKLS